MKKTTTVQYEFDEEDKRLLANRHSLPPQVDCGSCSSPKPCDGCADLYRWHEATKPYEDRGLLEVLLKLRRLDAIEQEVSKLATALSALQNERSELERFVTLNGLSGS